MVRMALRERGVNNLQKFSTNVGFDILGIWGVEPCHRLGSDPFPGGVAGDFGLINKFVLMPCLIQGLLVWWDYRLKYIFV